LTKHRSRSLKRAQQLKTLSTRLGEHVTRLGARERLQEDPREKPAHHLVCPLCTRPDPPKRRTQIKTPSPYQHIPKGKPQRTKCTLEKPCKRGIWTGEKRPWRWMDGTVRRSRTSGMLSRACRGGVQEWAGARRL